METNRLEKNAAVSIVRWSARVLGVMTSAFFLFMFIGESLESRTRTAPLEAISAIGPAGVIGLTLNGIYVLAMLLALRWERIGLLLGAGALGCFFVMVFLGLFHGNVSGGLSTKGILNPFLLVFWLPILLYFVCRRLEGAPQERPWRAL